jgi:hypothetical protein
MVETIDGRMLSGRRQDRLGFAQIRYERTLPQSDMTGDMRWCDAARPTGPGEPPVGASPRGPPHGAPQGGGLTDAERRGSSAQKRNVMSMPAESGVT